MLMEGACVERACCPGTHPLALILAGERRCADCGAACTEDGIHFNNATFAVTLQNMLNVIGYEWSLQGAQPAEKEEAAGKASCAKRLG